MGTMNEVSIIINGVRYDAVELDKGKHQCDECELPTEFCESCGGLLNVYQSFKKSTKSFER